MKKLTDRQQNILAFINRKVKQLGFPPTVQEMADEFGFKSKNAAFKHLEALERKGYIRRAAGGARGITILNRLSETSEQGMSRVPLIGTVAAGTPVLAEENIERYVPVPDYLTDTGGSFYALRVKGDSMIDAGILEGDLVIVQSAQQADNGEIVVALNDDEATVKRFVRTPSQIYLKPENATYPDIPLTENWSIQGKVVALIREHI